MHTFAQWNRELDAEVDSLKLKLDAQRNEIEYLQRLYDTAICKLCFQDCTSEASFLLLFFDLMDFTCLFATKEATAIRRELEEATQACEHAEQAMRAAQSDLPGLTMVKRDLEGSVAAKQDACGILRVELQESKEAQGKLRHEVGTLDVVLKCQVGLCKGH